MLKSLLLFESRRLSQLLLQQQQQAMGSQPTLSWLCLNAVANAVGPAPFHPNL